MTCPVCGATAAEGLRCAQCGHPDVPEAAAKMLAEARGLLAAGALEQSIRIVNSAVKAAPDSAIAHLHLALAYERKVLGGEPALARPAEREFREALRLAPADREVHLARLGFWCRTGRIALLRAEYRDRGAELPFAGECLKVLDALERTGTAARELDVATGATAMRARFFFVSGAGLGAVGTVELAVVILAVLRSEEYVMMTDMNFFVAVGSLTAAAVCILEGFRARKAGVE